MRLVLAPIVFAGATWTSLALQARAARAADGAQAAVEAGGDGVTIWLAVALAVLALATAVAVAVSFYLYRWRRILLASPHMLVPEELGAHLERLAATLDGMEKALVDGVGHVGQRSENTDRAVANLVETFMTLRQALDQRDAEIRRLKQGHDAEVFRRFLRRFIRVDQTIADVLGDDDVGKDSLEYIRQVLADAFDECGVQAFEPAVGEDYRESEGVADNPKLVEPADPADAFKIAAVLEAGYRLRTSEGFDVILPAKVSIYANKNVGEET